MIQFKYQRLSDLIFLESIIKRITQIYDKYFKVLLKRLQNYLLCESFSISSGPKITAFIIMSDREIHVLCDIRVKYRISLNNTLIAFISVSCEITEKQFNEPYHHYLKKFSEFTNYSDISVFHTR